MSAIDTARRRNLRTGSEGPEEGEIVDDFEYIISSDEEINMRQRIKQLEATNDELERIAHISEVYEKSDYDYLPVRNYMSIYSSDRYIRESPCDLKKRKLDESNKTYFTCHEEITISKKRKRKKIKTRKSKDIVDVKNLNRYSKHRNCGSGQTFAAKKNLKRERQSKEIGKHLKLDDVLDTISLDSYDDNGKRKFNESESESERSATTINREELRFALSRPKKYFCSLNDQFQEQKFSVIGGKFDSKCEEPVLANDIEILNCPDDSNSSNSLEEQELRLIALKSAVMKKHYARKKRNAEVAYSPSDFDNLLSNADICEDTMDVVEELENFQTVMEISPAASPKMMLSPEYYNNYDEFMDNNKCVESTKPIDMDIVDSESDDQIPPKRFCSWQSSKLESIEQISLPNELIFNEKSSDNTEKGCGVTHFNKSSTKQINPFVVENCDEAKLSPASFNFLLQYCRNRDDKNETYNYRNDMCSKVDDVPPPPPFTLNSDNCNSCDISNESINFHSNYTEYIKINDESATSFARFNNTNTSYRNNNQTSEAYDTLSINNTSKSPDSDEEEQALRALLLSKFNSPKSNNNAAGSQSTPNQRKYSQIDLTTEPDDSEVLHLQANTSIQPKKPNINSSETILKDALRRLKTKSNLKNINIFEDKVSTILEQESVNQFEGDFENILHVPQINEQSTFGEDKNEGHKRPLDKSKSMEIETNLVEDSDSTFNFNSKTNSSTFLLEEATGIINSECSKNENTSKNTEYSQHCINDTSDIIDIHSTNEHTERQNINDDTDNKTTIDVKYQKSPTNEMNVAEEKHKLTTPNKSTENNVTSKKSSKLEQSAHLQMLNPASKIIPTHSKSITNSNQSNNSREVLKPNKIINREVGLISISREAQHIDTKQNPELKSKKRLSVLKVVKPNKVINTKTELISNTVSDNAIINIHQKQLLKTAANRKRNIDSPETVTRKISSVDLQTIKVKKLIIKLNDADSETSEDEVIKSFKASVSNPTFRQSAFEAPQSLISTINNDYYANGSPLSLPIESPICTPIRSKSPCINSNLTSTEERNPSKITESPLFEERLDNFLNNIRNKTQTKDSVILKKSTSSKSSFESIARFPEKKYIPPAMTLKHLPAAAQKEYCQLLHRMMILEKQKKLRKLQNIESNKSKKTLANSMVTTDVRQSEQLISENQCVSRNSTDCIVGKVLSKTTSTNNVMVNKPSSKNLLSTYETSFIKLGSNIISKLNKSLQMVEQAKEIKIAKTQYAYRLEELKKEMKEVESNLEQQEKNFCKIYPEISKTNNLLTSLKQRRSKLFKAALHLGKCVKGDDYRLDNELKQEILQKTIKLSEDIKFVNSITYSDLKISRENFEYKMCSKEEENETSQRFIEKKGLENVDNDLEKNKENHNAPNSKFIATVRPQPSAHSKEDVEAKRIIEKEKVGSNLTETLSSSDNHKEQENRLQIGTGENRYRRKDEASVTF